MPRPVKLKMEDGQVILKDGLPVFVFDDNSESPLDVIGTFERHEKKIANLDEEKSRHFKNYEKAAESLKQYDGLDLEKIKEHAEIVQNLKDKEILDQNGIKALKTDMKTIFDEEKKNLTTAFENERKEWGQREGNYENTIYRLAITNKFATSPYFSGENPKTIYPAEDAAMIFGKHFKVKMKEDGNIEIRAYDANGNVILSKKNHGEPAVFDEAIEQLVEGHAKKHAILNTGKPGGPRTAGNLSTNDKEDLSGKPSFDKIRSGLKRRLASA